MHAVVAINCIALLLTYVNVCILCACKQRMVRGPLGRAWMFTALPGQNARASAKCRRYKISVALYCRWCNCSFDNDSHNLLHIHRQTHTRSCRERPLISAVGASRVKTISAIQNCTVAYIWDSVKEMANNDCWWELDRTTSWAVADRPRDASCHWIYFAKSLKVIQNDTVEWGVCKSLLVFHSNYVCISYRFWDILRQNGVTLKPGVGVVQGHWKWRSSIDHKTTSHWSAIVSIALCCTIFELFDVK